MRVTHQMFFVSTHTNQLEDNIQLVQSSGSIDDLGKGRKKVKATHKVGQRGGPRKKVKCQVSIFEV